MLAPTFTTMQAEDFGPAFATAVTKNPMVYGRLSVGRDGFFDPAMLVSYAPVDGAIPLALVRMTADLIDAVGEIGGTYYLPCRPHARLDQVTKIYPRAAEFAAFKRQVDPGLVLRGGLWDNYLDKL